MLKKILFNLLLTSILPAAVLAQGITTGSMNGTVFSSKGEPLIGANVVAVHNPTGTTFGAATRTDGRFNILNMKVGGPYTVTVTYIGYKTEKAEDIYLGLAQDLRLTFTLREEALELAEIVTVAERDAILTSSNTGTVNNVTTTQIERLPTITRSISDFTRLTPQVSSVGGTGANSVAGKNNRLNNFQVDGAVLNDVFGLDPSGQPTGQANAQAISLDAIQEFQVQIAPYDVRSGGFAGGLINAITRSGTNHFDGSGYIFGRGNSFVGDLQGDSFDSFDDFQSGFRFGGPLVQDKAFFFVNTEIGRRNQDDNGGLIGSGAANAFGLTSTEMEKIIDISKNVWNYDPGGFNPFTNQTDNEKVFARFDLNLSDRHRLTVRDSYVHGDRDDGIRRSSSTFTLESNQFKRDNKTNSFVLQLNSTFGNNMANEARIAFTTVRDKRTPLFAPAPQIQLNLEDSTGAEIGEVRFGVERFSQANALDQDVFEFTDNLNYFTGKHTFTFGTHNEFVSFDNLFIQDFFGAYEFDSIEDFRNGTPTRYLLSLSSLPGVKKPRANWDYIQLGFYAQDEWKVNPRLNLTLGLRADIPLMPDDPLQNDLFQSTFGRRTSNVPTGNVLWSPRFGFNLDVSGDRTTQVRGGVGIFAGLPPAVWLSNAYSNTGVDFARIDLATFNGEDVPRFSPDPNNQPVPAGAVERPPSDIAILDNDFRLPQVLRTNIAVDRQLPYGLVGTAEFLYGKNINEVFFKNLNVGDFGKAVGVTPDGRPDYGGLKPSPDFNTVILLDNTSNGFQWDFTLRVQKQLNRGPLKGLFGSFAYLLSKSEDINSGRSSRAISNWRFNETRDPNGQGTETSDFEVRERIVMDMSYRLNYLRGFATTFSLFYEGRSGSPFSYMYRDDANGDRIRGNDLAFIPASADDIANPANWPAIEAFINSEPSLQSARGKIFPRNSARAPWQDRLDFRIAQTIPSVRGQNLEFTLDVLNVLNLLNSDWGQIKFVRFDAVNLFNFKGYDANGKPDLSLRQRDTNGDGKVTRNDVFQFSDLASRWQIQLGVRYTF
ncbi:MAG: carboxypeptidase regulatory-like domain-containing protein [bacterium]